MLLFTLGSSSTSHLDMEGHANERIELGSLADLLVITNVCISILYGWSAFSAVGITLGDFFNPSTLMFKIVQNGLTRYNGEENVSALYIILSALNLAACFISGAAYRYLRKRRILTLIPLLTSLIIGSMMAAKIGFLFAAGAFLSAFLSTMVFERKKIGLRSIFLVVVGVVGFSGLIQFFRYGTDMNYGDVLTGSMTEYTFGSYSALAVWLRKTNLFHVDMGIHTFAAPLNLLNIVKRETGLYEMTNIGKGVETNVYSAIRPMVEDFSIIGSMVFVYFWGAIFSWAFKNVRARMLRCVPILSTVVFIQIFAFVTNPLMYSTIWVAIFLFYIEFTLIFRKAPQISSERIAVT
jgi:oligosaccharide repeat unit polymerase